MSDQATTPKTTEPTVKVTPDFRKGETVLHIGEKTKHEIINIDPVKKIVLLSGIATKLPITAIEKIIP